MSFGIAAEVEDATGAVWTLLESMDGTRSVDEIVHRIVHLHPEIPSHVARAGIYDFIESGHVEDAAGPEPPELTARDKARYDRSLRYFRWVDLVPRATSWEPQARLLRSSVTVVGLGGSGGVAAMALAASGVGRLHCVDPDVVELSNLNRQILYTEEDLGRPKAEAAVTRLRRLNADISVTGADQHVSGIADLSALAENCDVLLLAADDPADIRVWTNRACLGAGTPWVEAGYNGPLVGVGVFVPGDGACFECLLAADDDRRRALGLRREDAPDWDTAVARAVAAPPAGVSAYLAAHAVLAHITGAPQLPPGRRYSVNLAALDQPHLLADPRRSDCPACGDGAREEPV
jgi:bacteriocin biosynthesis cyclodehydratase domain-containing protein